MQWLAEGADALPQKQEVENYIYSTKIEPYR
jgi:hypothetical protein